METSAAVITTAPIQNAVVVQQAPMQEAVLESKQPNIVNNLNDTFLREIGNFIAREDPGSAPAGLNHYGSHCFYHGMNEWYVDFYTSAVQDSDGEFALDDSNRFFIRICSTADQYVIFDEYVQLGIPEVDVFEDASGSLHVVLKDVRSSHYEVTDFAFDNRSYGFNRNTLIEKQAVNYLGSY